MVFKSLTTDINRLLFKMFVSKQSSSMMIQSHFNIILIYFLLFSATRDDGKTETEKIWYWQEASTSLLSSSAREAWERIQERQIFECQQTPGALEMPQPNRSSNKDVVSEQTYKMEEAADVTAQDRSTTRNVQQHSHQSATDFFTEFPAQLLHQPADSSPAPWKS